MYSRHVGLILSLLVLCYAAGTLSAYDNGPPAGMILTPGDYPVKKVVPVAGKVPQLWTESLQEMKKGYRCGEIDTNQGKLLFRLCDTNGNARYSDPWVFPRTIDPPIIGDIVVFDWRGIGFDKMRLETMGTCGVGTPISVAGKLYVVSPSSSGDKLTVAAYTSPTGKVAVTRGEPGIVARHLTTALLLGGPGSFNPPIDGSEMDVPIGEYCFFSISARMQDRSARTWIFYCHSESPIHVKERSVTHIDIRGPLSISVAPESGTLVFRRGRKITVPLVLFVGSMRMVSGGFMGGSNNDPLVHLTEAGGRVVVRGEPVDRGFGYEIDVPMKLRPGRYIVDCKWNVGPFGGILKASCPAIVE